MKRQLFSDLWKTLKQFMGMKVEQQLSLTEVLTSVFKITSNEPDGSTMQVKFIVFDGLIDKPEGYKLASPLALFEVTHPNFPEEVHYEYMPIMGLDPYGKVESVEVKDSH